MAVNETDELNSKLLAQELWSARALLAISFCVCTCLGAAGGSLVPEKYEASITVEPRNLEEMGNLGSAGSLASSMRSLVSAGGFSMSGGQTRGEAVAMLSSEQLTEDYIRDNDLIALLYAEDWDATDHRWKSIPADGEPTLWKASRFFGKSVREVTERNNSDLVVLTIRWQDPKLAAQWANGLVARVNQTMRAKAVRDATRNIEYLQDQQAKTNIVELREAIAAMLQREIDNRVVAQGREEYALRVIDPAAVPEKPTTPPIPVWAALGGVVGLCLAMMAVAVRYSMTRGGIDVSRSVARSG